MDAFILGADLSHLAWLESLGAVYRNGRGPCDAIGLCRARGLDTVRLRVYAGATADACGNMRDRSPTLDQLLPLARRVRDAGMRLLLDFHFTDTWADPQAQPVPKAWAGLSGAGLEAAIARHCREVMVALADDGIRPPLVQLGNEITNGILWPHGRIDGDDPRRWDALAGLLRAAADGVLAGADGQRPSLVIHLDRGGDWEATRRFMDRIGERGVPWDILGLSYYPFWHGPLEQLRACLHGAAVRYRRPVLIAETASHQRPVEQEASPGLESTAAGQVEFVQRLGEVVRSVPERRGCGIVWWGAEYLPIAGVLDDRLNARACFDADGHALPVLAALAAQRPRPG